MSNIDSLIGAINRLVYGAQFDTPMSKAAPRVYDVEVDARRPTYSVERTLEEIVEILAAETLPINALILEDKSEQEVRDFLAAVAEEIERQNLDLIRPGRPIPQSGIWISSRDPQLRVHMEKEALAPIDPHAVWMHESITSASTPRERILNDFRRDLKANSLRGLEYADPEEFASSAFDRLSAGVDALGAAEMASEFERLRSPSASTLSELKQLTGFDWNADEMRRTFLQKYAEAVSRKLAAGKRDSTAAT